MRILLTGGTGLLGKALIEVNKDMHRVWAIYLGNYNMPDNAQVTYFNVNVCNKEELGNIFSIAKPELVIHAAGIANVDYCERNYEEARYSNVIGTKNVIDFCKTYSLKLVYISSSTVFDGKNVLYSEKDAPSPIHNYGKIKLECERIIKNSNLKHLILRPVLMYGWNNKNERPNLVTWLIEKLKSRERAYIVDDVYTNPLLNHNCGEIIWSLIKLDKKGIYHIAGKDLVSRYEFARTIADVLGLSNGNLIMPVSSDFFPDIAPRPKYATYNTEKIENVLSIKPMGLKEGLLYLKMTRDKYEDKVLPELKCQR